MEGKKAQNEILLIKCIQVYAKVNFFKNEIF